MQWANLTVLSFPPPKLNIKPTNESYVRAFPDWTRLTYTPEVGYVLRKAEMEGINATTPEVLAVMQTNRLYNQKLITDVFLEVEPKSYMRPFSNKQMGRYLRFMIIEGGLNGIFLKRTPKEYIEGFLDPTVYKMQQ